MFTVRIVDADFYVTKPVAGLDILYSEFRESNVSRVPVVRIFGSTPSGQKTCLHVHQVFPYIFVPYDGTQPSDKYLRQFTTSVDFAVQVALGKASTSTHHVYDASVVKRIPFYGYHEEEQEFIKIQFYNPRIVARVVELLQNGAILNKVFQPYESHIPFILQFLIDFNLYGMNLLHAGKVKFRGWASSETKDPKNQPSPCYESCSPFSSNVSDSFHINATSYQHWTESTIPSDSRLSSDVPKSSRCELEVDVISTDILNQLEIGTSIGRNPGIVAMWEDEKQRRRQNEQSSQIELPVSQDRGDLAMVDSEKEFKARIREIISERNQLIQSQLDKMEKSHVDSLSPEDYHELSQNILLEAKEPESPVIISEDVDENKPVVDETVIEDVLQASQSQPEQYSGRLDSDLIDILVSLADDPNQPVPQECSPTSGTGESKAAEDSEVVNESENEDEESLIMSQPLWPDEGLSSDPAGSLQRNNDGDVEEMAVKSPRVPQLDGTVDEESDSSLSGDTPMVKDEEVESSGNRMYACSSVGEDEDRLYFECSSKRIPQLDGCHDDKDDGQGNGEETKSSSQKTVFKSLLNEKEVEEDDDFKTGKKRKSNRTEHVKSCIKAKSKPITRRRKCVIAPLSVSGENLKERETSNYKGSTSNSEASTSKTKQTAKSKKEKACSKKKNARLDGASLNPEMKDLSSLPLKGTVGRRAIDLGWEILSRKTSQISSPQEASSNSKAVVELPSESQTSDFELRLSDSSSDSSDFKNPKKIFKTSSLDRSQCFTDVNLLNSGKRGNSLKRSAFESYLGDENSSFRVKENSQNKEVSGTQKNFKTRRIVKSKKSEVNFPKNNKPKEKTRMKIVQCLEFAQDAVPVTKKFLAANSETLLCSQNANTSQKRSRGKKCSIEGDLHWNKRKKTDKCEVVKDFRSSEKDVVNSEEGKTKQPRGTILWDACVKLERLFVEKGKSKSKDVLRDTEKQKDSGVRQECIDELDSLIAEVPVGDEESDMLANALLQMAMLSPKSSRSDGESPPIPSSPSLNVGFSDELSAGLLNKPMTCNEVDGEGEEVVCIKDSFSSTWEAVDDESNNSVKSGQRDEGELDLKGDASVGATLTSDTLKSKLEELSAPRHSALQETERQEGNAGNLDDDECRDDTCRDAIAEVPVRSHDISKVGDSFDSQDNEELGMDAGQAYMSGTAFDNGGPQRPSDKDYVGEALKKGLEVTVPAKECQNSLRSDQFLRESSRTSEHVWKPAKDPPSPAYVLRTRDLYSLPHKRHQKAFCSDPKDVPPVSGTVGGRRLRVPSLSVQDLYEYHSDGNFLSLCEIRRLVGDHMDDSFVTGCLKTLDANGENGEGCGYEGTRAEIKLALMGERNVVITPAKLPPSPSSVKRWMEENRPMSKKIFAKKSSETSSKPNVLKKPSSYTEPRKLVETMEFLTVPPTEKIEATSTLPSGIPENREDVCGAVDENIENSGEAHSTIESPHSSGRSATIREATLVGQEGSLAGCYISQNSSCDSVIGPQHSTPLGNRAKSQKLFECTPVDSSTSCERSGRRCSQQEVGMKFVNDDRCPRIGSLRRDILTSQMKGNAAQEHRQASCDASYIEGPTPTNSFGFKLSQPNIQNAKTLHEIQYLTILSVELHIRTRKALRPDPEFDAICAIFYNIEHETKEGKKNITGVIVANNESTKLTRTETESKVSPSDDGTSTDDGVAHGNIRVSQGTSVDGTSRSRRFDNSVLWRTGFADDLEVITVNEESDAITRFVELVHHWDPDILVGFEVQMLSWGYLLQRSTTLGIDLASQLSRLQDSSGTSRFDAEKDMWGASHTSEITIAGRIVLNVWRLMRHEVTLNVYSFENIAYHVLHERIPLYTFQQLSRWWDQKLPHNRWRTAEHYIRRCQGNVRILNHSDFVNRTSEFARLYGILFYNVVARGSQFRVESMMLRLAKPMNYLAVSPSIQQRARMCAPECIPLVMEPESRFYTDPVVVLDFQSLYPSMIIAYNYCFSTCLGRVSRLNELGSFEFGCTSLNIPPVLLEKLEDDIHVSANGVAFVKPNVRRGILPRMLEEILNTRVMVKKAMKEYKHDKALACLLDARQLGLKLIANVTYGYTSANYSGRMPCVEIADAIVRKARETLERAIHLVNNREEWGARVVYGDTDSLFVLLEGATKEEAFKIGEDIVKAVTATNPKPVKLKFEKVYLPCVLQTKKRYVGYMYETLDQKEPVFDAKGIETVRRDTCPAVAKVLEKSLRIIFETKDVSLVKKYVQRQFRKLMEERVSLQDLIFAKEYRGMRNYKASACVPALELTRRRLSRDRRAEPRVGERVPYVVVFGSPGLPLIQLVKNPEEVLEDPSLRLNASYYINKQILPPLDRVFALIGIDVSTWYSELPRFAPRQQATTGKQKSTISRYFTTLHCPVCEELTRQGLCHVCRKNPQKAVVTLADRIRNWERKYDHLTQICFQCCGTRDPEMLCVSLDCPVLFKMTKSKRNLNYAESLREVQRKIEVANQ